MTIDSALGVGTTVTVRIPVLIAAADIEHVGLSLEA